MNSIPSQSSIEEHIKTLDAKIRTLLDQLSTEANEQKQLDLSKEICDLRGEVGILKECIEKVGVKSE